MEVQEALQARRSVRKFTADPVTPEQLDALMHAAMSGPSACNKQPWEFYIVTDPEILAGLRTATRFTGYECPCAIVVCGNLSHSLPMNLADFWIQDCSAATQNILLCAVDLGLGTVWCGIHPQKRPAEKVRKLLELPEKQIPLNIVYVGVPDTQVQPGDWYRKDRIHMVEPKE